MKSSSYITFLIVLILYVGCLVPGAPRYRFYGRASAVAKNCDTILMSSFQFRGTSFHYETCTDNVDSVFMFNSENEVWDKMQRLYRDEIAYYYLYISWSGRKKKRLESVSALKLVKFYKESLLGDTVVLQYTDPPDRFK